MGCFRPSNKGKPGSETTLEAPTCYNYQPNYWKVILYPSCGAIVIIVVGIVCAYLSWHGFKHRNFLFATNVHLCLQYMHIKYWVIPTHIFKSQPFWLYSLIRYTAYIDTVTESHTSASVCIYIQKDSVIVIYFQKFITFLWEFIYHYFIPTRTTHALTNKVVLLCI